MTKLNTTLNALRNDEKDLVITSMIMNKSRLACLSSWIKKFNKKKASLKIKK